MNTINKSYIAATDRFSSTTPDLVYETNIAWSAVLMGALASIGLSFLLNLFSMAIGLTAISTNAAGKGTLAIGGLIGLLIGAIACMFFSGWLAGYIARPSYRNPNVGGIYGFSAWCLALLITILTASYVGKFITDTSYFLSNPSAVSEVAINQRDNISDTSALARPSIANNQGMSSEEKSVKAASISTFIIFIMSFVEALSSTIGGYYAGLGNRKDIP